MQEIERKYLVTGDAFRVQAHRSVHIAQGYLCLRRVTARVRIYGDAGFLTLKSKSRDGGLSRFEWERPIPVGCARRLLERCSVAVEKVRHLVEHEGYTWEVDEFAGDNEGLVIAEVELASTTDRPSLPEWVGKEVTGVKWYYNSFLTQCPYKNWK